MRWIIIALSLVISSWAQLATQEATPIPVQSNRNAAASLAFNNNVVSGHELFVAYECFSGGNCASGPSIADTLTTTWTSRVTQGSTTCGNLWIWTGQAGSSGADTVTITNGGSFQNIAIAEFANVSNTLDVASTATAWTLSGTTITTPSVTTNTNNALLFAAAHTCNSGQVAALSPTLPVTDNSSADSMGTGWRITGTNGANTATFNWASGGSSGNSATVVMKANTALTVVTTKIPDAVSGTAYSFDLHANGGSGSYTWSQTAGTLPTGLSLSSGGTISGTPTAGNADQNMTFHVVDGASATADSASLTLHVGTSFNTAALLQSHTASGCGTNVFSSNVASGSLLLVVYSSNGNGMATFTDSLGTVYAYLPFSMEMISGASAIANYIAWGFAPSAGADTITCTGTAAAQTASEFSNIQKTFDPTVWVATLGTSASPYSTASLTTPVIETLFAWVMPFTSTATITTQSPYTAGVTITAGSTQMTAEYAIAQSAGSKTATFAATGNTDGHWGTALTAFRATTSGTAPASGNCAACELSKILETPFR
jgi:large repetitive protein